MFSTAIENLHEGFHFEIFQTKYINSLLLCKSVSTATFSHLELYILTSSAHITASDLMEARNAGIDEKVDESF